MTGETCFIPVKEGTLFSKQWTPEQAGHSDRAPILLLHDSLGSVDLWRDFPQALAEATGRRVIAYDRLGFGQSSPVDQPIAMDFIAREARDILPQIADHLQLSQWLIMGHSVGGAMAVQAAAQHPERCAGLITEAAQAFVEAKTRDGIREAKALFQTPGQFDRLCRYHGERTQWVLDAWINSWLSEAFDHWSLDDVLPDVRCPSLVLHGSDDEYGSSAQPERLARYLGGPVTLSVLPDLHHVPHREKPDIICHQIANFAQHLP